jgi:thiol:disulfide interchange protein DsbD
MKSTHMRLLAGLTLTLAMALGLSPAAQGPPRQVTWSVTLDPKAGVRAPGDKLTALVTAKLEDGWHVYAPQELPDGPRGLRIDLVPGGPAEVAGAMVSPEPEREFDEAFSQVTAYYKETAMFRVPLAIGAKAKAGAGAVDFEISFQACDGRMCLPGRTVRVSAPVAVSKGSKVR